MRWLQSIFGAVLAFFRRGTSGSVDSYDAFISYSHAADGKLAPALQYGMQRFARPWYRPAALRVFRDETNLSAAPQLWPTIERALAASRYFILLASPAAVKSPWVRDEVNYWLTHKNASTLLLVQTDGEIQWDSAASRFTTGTNAVPALLRDCTTVVPKWIDMRWARAATVLTLRSPQFADAVASLAAPVRGKLKEQLIGEALRQKRVIRALVAGVVAALTALALAATWFGIEAAQNARAAQDNFQTAQKNLDTANRNLQIATRNLAGQVAARALGMDRKDDALAVAATALRVSTTDETVGDMLSLLERTRHIVRFQHPDDQSVNPSSLRLSDDGDQLIATFYQAPAVLWNLETGHPTEIDAQASAVVNGATAVRADGRVAISISGNLRLFSIRGNVVSPGQTMEMDETTAIAFAGNGVMALATETELLVGRAEPLQLEHRQAVEAPLRHLVFSDDGRELAGISYDESQTLNLEIRDATSLKLLSRSPAGDAIGLGFRAGHFEMVRTGDLATKYGYGGTTVDRNFTASRDLTRLAVANALTGIGLPDTDTTITVYRRIETDNAMETGLPVLRSGKAIPAAALSPTGKTTAVISDAIRVFDTATGALRRTVPCPTYRAACQASLRSDDELLLTRDDHALVSMSISAGKTMDLTLDEKRFGGTPSDEDDTRAERFAMSHDGSSVATFASTPGEGFTPRVAIWQLRGSAPAVLVRPGDAVEALAFGQRLVAVSAERLTIWSAQTGRKLGDDLPIEGQQVSRLEFTAEDAALRIFFKNGTFVELGLEPSLLARAACAVANDRLDAARRPQVLSGLDARHDCTAETLVRR
ncbi:MAG: hypothetical protein QOH21_3480 [Acidobacteriota bacterium]|nr:hypothetical protein [Acidobacteriota bacterium]